MTATGLYALAAATLRRLRPGPLAYPPAPAPDRQRTSRSERVALAEAIAAMTPVPPHEPPPGECAS